MFHLTNRIRTNAELSSFIQNMMHYTGRKISNSYPHVSAAYANDDRETEILLKDYTSQGYQYRPPVCTRNHEMEMTAVRDVKRLVIVLDDRYYYDKNGYLRSRSSYEGNESEIRSLFHQLNQAKEELSIIVKENKEVYETLLTLLQPGKV